MAFVSVSQDEAGPAIERWRGPAHALLGRDRDDRLLLLCFLGFRKLYGEDPAKRAQGPYASGRRTREWLKIKTGLRQEVVIVGYTRPQRSRQYFGALVLAVRQGGKWKYVGRAGTGFDRDSLKSIHARLVRLRSPRKPIDAIVPGERATTWVRPRLVCEVKFTEWTADGQMRHPAFVGLRTDKPARSVVRERRALA